MVPVRSGAAPLHPTPPAAARLNQALGAISSVQRVVNSKLIIDESFYTVPIT